MSEFDAGESTFDAGESEFDAGQAASPHECPDELMLVKAVRPASLRGTTFVRMSTQDACHRMSEIAREHDVPPEECVFVIVPYSRRLRVDTNNNATRAMAALLDIVTSLPPSSAKMTKPELVNFADHIRLFVLRHGVLCDVDPGMEGTC